MANSLGAWLIVALLVFAGRGLGSALSTAELGAVEDAVYLHGATTNIPLAGCCIPS